jgi:hypothetical protein
LLSPQNAVFCIAAKAGRITVPFRSDVLRQEKPTLDALKGNSFLSESIWIIALGAVVAGFVQGLSGFAFGLVAMSFWVWTIEPQLAAVLVVFGALTGQIIGMVSVRRGFAIPLLLPFLLGGIVGIPIGVAILPSLDTHLFKAGLGALLVFWCPIMLFSRRVPPIRFGGHVADSAAGLIGGVMAGMGGFSGPVPSFGARCGKWRKTRNAALSRTLIWQHLPLLWRPMWPRAWLGQRCSRCLPLSRRQCCCRRSLVLASQRNHLSPNCPGAADFFRSDDDRVCDPAFGCTAMNAEITTLP